MKKLPYGNSNFTDLIETGYAYVDKTRYIEMLENEHNRYQYFLRPRRFGKSLFLSVLRNYYDIKQRDRFQELFGDLYIGKHPTPEQGTYAVLSFDFSGIDCSDRDTFRADFLTEIGEKVQAFMEEYQSIFAEAVGEAQPAYIRRTEISALNTAYSTAKRAGIPLMILVDEYDHYANKLLSMGKAYKEEVSSTGVVRAFYETLKKGTSTVVKRIFMTGVSPMMVNDLTSGFNMADNLSLLPYYNEMFGFTIDEVEWLIGQTGIDKSLITVDMEYYYNGYMFNNKGENKVYNSQMVLFLFNQILKNGEQPEAIIDPNLRTSYERLQRLAENENNRVKLLEIIRDGGIYGTIIDSFSIDDMTNDEYFVSLLFYLGMLTCGGTYRGQIWLKIPNYSIRTLYWEYVGHYIKNAAEEPLRTSELKETISNMAFDGDIKPYLDFFTENILKRLSNRDLQKFDEKYVKAAMLSNLFLSSYYLPKSEDENTGGYSDIYLQKAPAIDEMMYEYVLEVKYVKVSDPESAKEEKFTEAFTQLEGYKKDERYVGKDNLKFAAIVFQGKSDYEIRNAAQ